MKISKFLIVLFLVYAIILVSGCASLPISNIEKIEKPIWVFISTKKNQETVDYRVQMQPKDFNNIMSGMLERGWIKLKPVYWYKKGSVKKQSVASSNNGLTDEIIIRIENIIKINPLTQEYIDSHLQ